MSMNKIVEIESVDQFNIMLKIVINQFLWIFLLVGVDHVKEYYQK
jgi:hypothetical protein